MKVGILQFPGSNCDQDMFHVCSQVMGLQTTYLWHKNTSLESADLIILPGGFSYGDYLRCGAIARFSPIMRSVIDHAKDGGLVLGVCNGFQILCESGLLPGALVRNQNLKFICKPISVKVCNTNSPATLLAKTDSVLTIPIAHGEGNYQADDSTLADLETGGQVVLRYCDASGTTSSISNPNGSRNNIAGICSAMGNVVGMMPHPERCSESALGCSDGLVVFESYLECFSKSAALA